MMKIGDRVICIKDYKDILGLKFLAGKIYKIKNIYTNTEVFEKSHKYIDVVDDQQRTNGFPMREKHSPIKNDGGIKIGYFDRYFINLKDQRKQKLLKIRNIS